MLKLVMAHLGKGSAWKKKVLKEDFSIDSKPLTREISLKAEESHVAAFKEVCGLKDKVVELPIIYPATLMVFPTCGIFASPEYPFPAVGSVHVRNVTTINRPLTVSEEFRSTLRPSSEVRHAKRGTEVDICSNLVDKRGITVWTNTSTFLVMHKQK